MNPPPEEKAAARLKQAIKMLAINESAAFRVFMEWVEFELKRRDEENRVIGTENTTSEAHALSVICEYVAACLAPVADRDAEGTGAEGTSADSLT